jgi:hypothetical protein
VNPFSFDLRNARLCGFVRFWTHLHFSSPEKEAASKRLQACLMPDRNVRYQHGREVHRFDLANMLTGSFGSAAMDD